MSFIGDTMASVNALFDKHYDILIRAQAADKQEKNPSQRGPKIPKTQRKWHSAQPEERIQEMIRLYYEEMLGCDAIGQLMGIPATIINGIFKKRGLTLRTRKQAAILRRRP